VFFVCSKVRIGRETGARYFRETVDRQSPSERDPQVHELVII